MKSLKIYIFLASVLIFISCSASFEEDKTNHENDIFLLNNWQYFTTSSSDSTVFSNTGDINWVQLKSLHNLPQNLNGKIIWLKTKLPEWKGASPSIYIGQVDYFMQVFLNGKMIYHLGDSSSLNYDDIIGWNQNLIQLPYYKAGDTITFRITHLEGSSNFEGNILIGPAYDIIKKMFIRNIDDLVFAIIFFITGIIFFIAYFTSRRSKLLLAVAVYLTPVSIFIAVNSLFVQLIFPAPTLYYHLDYISFIISTVGGFYSIEQIIEAKFKRILRYLWLIHLVFLIISIVAILFTKFTYMDLLNYFLVLLSINMITCLIVMILSIKKGEVENKILMAGMTIFIFSAFYEILFYLYGEWEKTFSYSMRVLHFGVLCYVIALILIVIYKYTNTNKQKEIAQKKELEAEKREKEARQQFARKLIESQENERNRIALELHDSVGQKLLLIKNQLLSEIRKDPDNNSTQYLNEISDLTGETIQEVRTISQNLRPQHLDQLGLTTAVETVIEKVAESSYIKFKMNIDNIDNLLPKEDEINFFRIIQESLNNIVKHSQATDASINIKRTDNLISLEIKDNGIGKNENTKLENASTENGLGITGMHERAQMIGAKLNIELSEYAGTVINMEYNF